jgi:hypothetical protein
MLVAKTAIPMRIRAPALMALIQWTQPVLATGNGKRSR